MHLPQTIINAAHLISREYGRAYVVGGSVRDHHLGLPVKDYDVEVFGIQEHALPGLLSAFGKVDLIGKSFGVYKLTSDEGTFDFSLPRLETKNGSGYTGFDVEVNHQLTMEEAAARRDFTINAVYHDVLSGEFFDPYKGLKDLQDCVIRHTSAKFSEDPLRVLRAFQFSSRFNFRVAPETIALCRSIKDEFAHLSTDRVWVEWEKWATKSKNWEIGLRFLDACEWLEHFPLLHKLKSIEQSPKWHPEGNVFEHTCHCLGAMSRIETPIADRGVMAFAVLTHDLGKITHTQIDADGKITAYGHEAASGPLAEEFLRSIRSSNHYIERVVPLVIHHMFQNHGISDTSVRRMALRVSPATIEELCALMECDKRGRPPHPDVCPEEIKEILEIARRCNVGSVKPSPLILGRHLIELGVNPGKQMGAVLHQCFEAQLAGKFSTVEDGILHAKRLI